MKEGPIYGQKEGKVGVVLVLMDEISEGGCLSHWGRGDRVQIRNDGFGVSVGVRASNQSWESGAEVELEEAGLEVPAIQEVNDLELDIDTEFSTEETMSEHARCIPIYKIGAHTAISETAAQTEPPYVQRVGC
jgi:hypothetical protein